MSQTLLVDLNNLVFRAHYAFRNLASGSRPTGVIYGVLRAVHDLRESVTKRMVFAWDHGVPVPNAPRQPNWRHKVLPTYKATRNRNDEEWRRVVCQLPLLNSALTEWLGYQAVGVAGLEADDVIGMLSRQLPGEVLIFSTDQDFYQLLDDRVHILVPQKSRGKFRRISQADVEREHGFPVGLWSDYLALGGDHSDNIKPAAGMGPKTAARLIQAGVRLSRPLELQPRFFREKYGKVWDNIMRAHAAARIPTSAQDARLAKFLPGFSGLGRVDSTQRWDNARAKHAAMLAFDRCCADNEMFTLFQLRRQLFDERGDTACIPTKPTMTTRPPRFLTKSQRVPLI